MNVGAQKGKYRATKNPQTGVGGFLLVRNDLQNLTSPLSGSARSWRTRARMFLFRKIYTAFRLIISLGSDLFLTGESGRFSTGQNYPKTKEATGATKSLRFSLNKNLSNLSEQLPDGPPVICHDSRCTWFPCDSPDNYHMPCTALRHEILCDAKLAAHRKMSTIEPL